MKYPASSAGSGVSWLGLGGIGAQLLCTVWWLRGRQTLGIRHLPNALGRCRRFCMVMGMGGETVGFQRVPGTKDLVCELNESSKACL